jgi:hypothetical protein
LAEKVRQTYGTLADIDVLLLVASVTEENGSQRIAVEGNVLEPYQQATHLRHALSTISSSWPEDPASEPKRRALRVR